MKRNIVIKIDDPCHEKWLEMTPGEQGRFCARCSRHVIDFTKMSDEALVSFFNRSKGSSVCGHFHQDQLNRTVSQTMPVPGYQRFYKALAGLFLFLTLDRTAAQKPVQDTQLIVNKVSSRDTVKTPKKKVENPKHLLKGVVVDTIYNVPLTGVIIELRNNLESIVVKSDTNGYFELIIPDTLYEDNINIFTHYAGYASQNLRYSIKNIPEDPINVYMLSMNSVTVKDDTYLIGIIAVDTHPITRWQRFRSKVKSFWNRL